MIMGPMESIYVDTDLEFYVNSEDVRLLNIRHEELPQVRRSQRHGQAKKKYEINKEDIESLKLECYTPLDQLE